MSPDLIAFLKAWHDWATSGAPDKEPFSRGTGLCGNALQGSSDVQERWRLREEIIGAFNGQEYPFSYAGYWRRAEARTQHECPKRLAWVRERLVEAGELVA